jgi:hypothetical protein
MSQKVVRLKETLRLFPESRSKKGLAALSPSVSARTPQRVRYTRSFILCNMRRGSRIKGRMEDKFITTEVFFTKEGEPKAEETWLKKR